MDKPEFVPPLPKVIGESDHRHLARCFNDYHAWAAAQSQPTAESVGDEGLVELIARAICRNDADEIVQGGDVVGQPVDMPAWMLYEPEARRVAAALRKRGMAIVYREGTRND